MELQVGFTREGMSWLLLLSPLLHLRHLVPRPLLVSSQFLIRHLAPRLLLLRPLVHLAQLVRLLMHPLMRPLPHLPLLVLFSLGYWSLRR